MSSSHLAWWVTRSTGIVAWALVTASILWGLMLSSRIVTGRGTGPWLLDLHRWLGTLALVFTGAHIGSLLIDSYVGFSVADLFIPFESTWRPRALVWGIAGFYLLVLVQVTSWLKRRMPKRLWHAVHLLSIPLFVTASVHAALAGADRNNQLLQWLLLTAIILVVFMIVYRVVSTGTPPPVRSRAVIQARPTTPAGLGLGSTPLATPALAPRAGVPPSAVGLRREPLQLEDGTTIPVLRQLPAPAGTAPVEIIAVPGDDPTLVGPPTELSAEHLARLERLQRRRGQTPGPGPT